MASPDLNELNKKLSKVKVRLFMKGGLVAAFHGTIMTSLEFVWSEEIPTAAVDGKRLFFNPYFFEALPEEARLTVLLHELNHIAYDHISRFKNLNHKIANQAADHVINLELIDQGYSFKGLEFGCMDPRFKKMSMEQVYDILIKENPPQPGGCPALPGSAAGNQSGQNQSMGQSKPQPGQNQKVDATDVLPAPAGVDPSTHALNVATILVKARQAAQQANVAGQIPGDITQALDEYLNPVLPWDRILQNYLTDVSYDDYSYRRPSRRYSDPLMPGLMANEGLETVYWFFDISGSVTDDMILRCFSEAKHVFDIYRPATMKMITFDTHIRDVFEYTREDEFSRVEITGRGGTHLGEVHDLIKKDKPALSLIFSDLECSPMPDPGSQVFWLKLGDYGFTPTFGKIIQVPL